MKRCMLVTGASVATGGEELIESWRRNDDSWIWLDLYEEDSDAETELLSSGFDIAGFDVSDAQRPRQPPGVDKRDHYEFIVTKPLDSNSFDLDFSTLQLVLFVGENFIVTRRSKTSNYIDQLWQKLSSSDSDIRAPRDILALVLRRITDRYADVLIKLESRLDVIEDDLFDSSSDALMRELVSYNTSLRKMRRIIAYHQNVFQRLTTLERREDDEEWNVEIEDIYGMMQRNTSLADLYQSVITDLVDAYISLNGHRLNQIMKVLTVVTVIFVPITFLAGIYGMNFEYIPELKSRNGYYILLSVMSLIAAVLLFVFRKIRWV